MASSWQGSNVDDDPHAPPAQARALVRLTMLVLLGVAGVAGVYQLAIRPAPTPDLQLAAIMGAGLLAASGFAGAGYALRTREAL